MQIINLIPNEDNSVDDNFDKLIYSAVKKVIYPYLDDK